MTITYGAPAGPWKRTAVFVRGEEWGCIKDKGRGALARFAVKAKSQSWKVGKVTTNTRCFPTLTAAKKFITKEAAL